MLSCPVSRGGIPAAEWTYSFYSTERLSGTTIYYIKDCIYTSLVLLKGFKKDRVEVRVLRGQPDVTEALLLSASVTCTDFPERNKTRK